MSTLKCAILCNVYGAEETFYFNPEDEVKKTIADHYHVHKEKLTIRYEDNVIYDESFNDCCIEQNSRLTVCINHCQANLDIIPDSGKYTRLLIHRKDNILCRIIKFYDIIPDDESVDLYKSTLAYLDEEDTLQRSYAYVSPKVYSELVIEIVSNPEYHMNFLEFFSSSKTLNFTEGGDYIPDDDDY